MFVKIKAKERHYHTEFTQNKGVTTCKIFLLTEADGRVLVGRGTTRLGKKDKANSRLGCKFAFERALDAAKLGKEANTAFWKEFHRHDAVVIINEPWSRFSNTGRTFSGRPPYTPVHERGKTILPPKKVSSVRIAKKIRQYMELYGYKGFDYKQTINQCDGCRRGLPLKGGIHVGPGHDFIGCTKERYLELT